MTNKTKKNQINVSSDEEEENLAPKKPPQKKITKSIKSPIKKKKNKQFNLLKNIFLNL